MTERLQEKVGAYIRHHRLILPGERVLLGLSGGMDSVCLFHVLRALQKEFSFTLEAAHLNHMLRPGEAEKDEAFAVNLCREYEIPCHTQRIDVAKIAKARGIGEEMCGREVRYAFFRSLHPDKIAVAHHMSDQAETVLMHLLRGSGAEGISAMAPIERDVIRPFLDVRREELFTYAKERNHAWREDASNASEEYQRNRIRNLLLPQLTEENPKAVEHIAAFARRIREDHEALEEYAKNAADRVIREEKERLGAKTEDLLSLPRAVRLRVIRRMMGEEEIQAAHLEAAEKLLFSPTGKSVSLPGGKVAERENEWLTVGSRREAMPDFCIPIHGAGRYPLPDGRVLTVSEAGTGIAVSKAALEGTLYARSRQPGDVFSPYQGRGHKKLKDYFIDRKIPRRDRDRAVIIADNAGILALLPYDKDARADGQGEAVWYLSIEKE